MGFLRGLFRTVLTLVVIVGIVLAGLALWRGSGPLPDPEKCRASVDGTIVGLDPDQGELTTLIAAIGVRRNLPARAVSIALATAYQESKIRNLDHGDRDSVGIFQQRPSQGWGTEAELQDPHFATDAFYDALEKIDGYEDMRITEAAQAVQRSGFPEAYEDHAADARALASALTGHSDGGKFSCVVHETTDRGTRREVVKELTAAYGKLPITPRAQQGFVITIGDSAAEQRRGWSIAQVLVGHARGLHIRAVSYDGKRWDTGKPSEKGWTDEPDANRQIVVSMG